MTGGQQNEERSGETLVVAEALSLGYRGRPVLRDVTLRIGAGEIWFLLGPNGSGKSTFVAGVLGALTPLAGTLTLHPRLRDRSAIGVVPQRSEPNRLLPTTVRELVTLGAVGQRLDGPTRAARLEWALRHAGLAGAETRSFWQLSGGERQRALIARALVRRPQLLLLDEPTSHLDFVAEGAVLDAVRELHREERTTIVLVTHALHLAARHATHVALFGGGRVAAGPAAALLDEARLARFYGAGGGLREGR